MSCRFLIPYGYSSFLQNWSSKQARTRESVTTEMQGDFVFPSTRLPSTRHVGRMPSTTIFISNHIPADFPLLSLSIR